MSGFLRTVRKFGVIVFSIIAAVSIAYGQQRNSQAPVFGKGLTRPYGRLQPYFIENKGQWGSEVKFLFRSGGMDIWITDRGVSYDIHYERDLDTNCDARRLTAQYDPIQPFDPRNQSVERTGHVVRMEFQDCALHCVAVGSSPQVGTINYFLGNDSTKWVTNVRTYSEVTIENLYPGVDALFYIDKGMPRYELRLKAGADLTKLELRFNGQDSLMLDAQGNLSIATLLGNLVQSELLAYQIVNGVKEPVACTFQPSGDGTVRFIIGKHNLMANLVIDPIMYSTLIGGNGDDVATALAVDSSGDAIITGNTNSKGAYPLGFPTTSGAYQTTYGGGPEVFVTKLNNTGTGLIYSTYIGGTGGAVGRCIVLDSLGDVYVAGYAASGYPTTVAAFQSTFGGSFDAFVTKLNSTGSRLIYSTYLGGDSIEQAFAIALDGTGNAYVAGSTASGGIRPLGFPTTPGAYQTSKNGSGSDVFVSVLNPDGSDLLSSTFIGKGGFNQANAITLDPHGNIFITGLASDGFPTTAGAVQSVFAEGTYDAFVTKLNPNLSAIVYSTYLGGIDMDISNAIVLDPSGNAYIAGYSRGVFPTTKGAYQSANNGAEDAFVAKLNSTGTKLLFSTSIGGEGDDVISSIMLDSYLNIYVSGWTYSYSFPTTPAAFQRVNNGSIEAFVTKFTPSGSDLLYSTYIGGQGGDLIWAMVSGGPGVVYLAGSTGGIYNGYPRGYPTTPGAFQSLFGGDKDDGFVTKFGVGTSVVSLEVDTTSFSSCGLASVLFHIANTTPDPIVVDSVVIAEPFQVATGQLPLQLPPDVATQISLLLLPKTVGTFTQDLTLYYHSTFGVSYDTMLSITGTSNAVTGDIAYTTLPVTKAVQPLSIVDLPVNLILSNTRNLDTLQINRIDYAISYDSELLDIPASKLSSQIVAPPGLVYGSASISPGLLQVSLNNPRHSQFTDTLFLGDVLFTTYRGSRKNTLVELNSLTIETPDQTYDYCASVEGEYLANVIVAGSGVSPSQSESSIRVYPNPAAAKGDITIEIVNSKLDRIEASLLDVLGREVRRLDSRTLAQGTSRLKMSLMDLKPGSYYLRILSNGRRQTTKLVAR